MRRIGSVLVLLVSLWNVPGAGAGEGAAETSKTPQLDAAKYPQDTPQKALGSLVKALEARDLSYWIAHLITPADTKRLIEKHGGLEGAVRKNSDEKHAARLQDQLALMKQMLAGNAPTEGQENGVQWARFRVEQRVLQFEKQPDGRWCMNARVTSEK